MVDPRIQEVLMRIHHATTLVAILVLAVAIPAKAQFGYTGAQSTLFEPSVRFSAMGRTGTAVFWGSGPNDWANPALLGYNGELRFESSKTQLVPDLSDDVFLRTNRLVWGGWGAGISLAGRPLDALGGVDIDYGVSELTDVEGNIVRRVRFEEDNNTIALGVNALELVRHMSEFAGHPSPTLDRFGDISVGRAWKRIKYRIDEGTSVSETGQISESDVGYLLRATPYDAVRYPGLLPALEALVRLKLEGSYGASELNSDANPVTFKTAPLTPPQADVLEDHRRAVAFHAALVLPTGVESSWRKRGLGWIYDLTNPILSYGHTSEHTIFFLDRDNVGLEEERTGWEITVANVFSYRKGHQDDPNREIIGNTSGWGIGFHMRGIGGIQYDHATVPQSIYLGPVERNGFAISVDPIAVVRRLR
jgi:hypothetical protein